MDLTLGFPVAAGPTHGYLDHGFPCYLTIGVAKSAIWAKVSGEWKKILKTYIKASGSWREANLSIKDSGNWVIVG